MSEKPENPKDEIQRTKEESREGLKCKVRMFYDLQRIRIQVAGRTYDRPEGQELHLHAADVEILKLRSGALETAEGLAFKDVRDHLRTIPFYRKVLSDKDRFKGVGPAMAGVILSEFDINRLDTPSKMWAFAGLAPVAAKRCRSCHAVVEFNADTNTYHHTREAPRKRDKTGAEIEPKLPKCPRAKDALSEADVYASGKAMRPTKGQKLPYNSWLRTKLVGVLGSVLLKVGSPWRKFYDDYKHRKQSEGWGRSDAHRHQAAIRFMVKALLLEIWKEWRFFEGLPVRPSYQEEYLKHQHHSIAGSSEGGGYEEASPEVASELATLETA
jgi:hypothetical protein